MTKSILSSAIQTEGRPERNLQGAFVGTLCQGQDKIPQNGQSRIPQLKCSGFGLALLLHFGQLGEDTSLALFAQPIALTADVDGCRVMQ